MFYLVAKTTSSTYLDTFLFSRSSLFGARVGKEKERKKTLNRSSDTAKEDNSPAGSLSASYTFDQNAILGDAPTPNARTYGRVRAARQFLRASNREDVL